MRKAYILKISGQNDIPIDEEEILKAINAKKNKDEIVIFKKGIIFNANYIIGIFIDRDRMIEVIDSNKLNAHAIREGIKKPKEIESLSDDFAELRNNMKRLK